MARNPSPHLADLHERAARAGISGYRKLTRAELLEAIGDEPERVGTEPGTVEAELGLVEPELGPVEPRLDAADPDDLAEPGEDAVAEVATRPRRSRAGRRSGERDDREDAPTEPVSGVLEVTRQRFGFLRLGGLSPSEGDVYISAAQVRRCELRPGDEVSGPARDPGRGERHRALVHVDAINGEALEGSEQRPSFDSLDPTLPERRIALDGPGADPLLRAVDLLAPLALGQRVLVRAAPRSGRTTLLRALTAAAAAEGEVRAIVLLIDERPEEVPAWRAALADAELAIATADMSPVEQLRIAELATERARRLAERGADVILACDSLTRLAHAAGNVDQVKRLFGTGRNLSGAGSVTVIATTVAGGSDEGVAERAVITTESSLIALDPALAAQGLYPAIDPTACQVANEEDLRPAPELEAVRRLRSRLAELGPREASELLRDRLGATQTNEELLFSL